MGAFFDRLEEDHIAFMARQQLFFVATAAEGAHPNLSPKGYDTLRVLGPEQVVFVDWPGSGNQTATHVAEHGRITLMFCSFERAPLILRVYGMGRVLAANGPGFATLAARLDDAVGPHTRQLIDIRVQRVQTSCGYGVPLFEFEGPRETLQRYYDKRHTEVDWDAYLAERAKPQPPVAR
jgi:predicted pyridoxine 5'-phosphate oxidase superfamily flavin-nucleotide-binding protein